MPATAPTDLQAAFDRERREARQARPRTTEEARGLTVRMYGRMEAMQADAIATGGVKLACTAGCDFCCHLRVEVRAYEAFVLATHIATKWDGPRRARFAARLAATLEQIADMPAATHVRAGIACALLEDGLCAAYAARPAACRKYHSVAVATCRDAFAHPDAPLSGPLDDERVRLAANAVALGFAKGREEAGADPTLHELHFALAQALAHPAAERRYRDGKKPFV
jgi:Fe-S-cluster containining protein